MNKGSIRQKGKQSWQISIYAPGPDGKNKRYYETVIGLKRDAQRRLNELLVNLDKGAVVPSGKLTVEQHLDNWFNGYVKTKRGSWQTDGIDGIIKNHFKPAFGNVILQKLTPQMIQVYYGMKVEKLSPRTVHKHHRILCQSLKYAVRQGYLGHNPCDMVDPPRFVKKVARYLTPVEIEALFTAAADSYYFPAIYFDVNTGMRRNEILGLKWRDLDLDLLSISVNRSLYRRKGKTEFKEPKTAHSRRQIAMTPKLAIFMREYKAARESLYIQLGRVLGLDDMVFTNVDFQALHPSVLDHYFKRIVDKAGLSDGVTFHALRHTFASIMLLRGVPLKVVSEALGHASVAFTADTYCHIIKGMQEDAMKLLDEVLPSANYSAQNNNFKSISANLAPIVDNKLVNTSFMSVGD